MNKVLCLMLFALMLISFPMTSFASDYAVLLNECEALMENAKNDDSLTHLVVGTPEEEDYVTDVYFNANTNNPYLLATWLKVITHTPVEFEWSFSEAFGRCSESFQESIVFSSTLEANSMTPLINTQTLNALASETEGHIQFYPFASAYLHQTVDGIEWEICPLVILDSENQIFEGAMYVFVRKLENLENGLIALSEYLSTDPEVNYRLLHMQIEGGQTFDDSDASNIQVWFDLYESVL